MSAISRTMKRFLLFLVLVALTLLAISRWNQQRRTPETFTPAPASAFKPSDLPLLAAMDQETTRLVQAVIPSVVSITTARKVSAPPVIDPFELFFGRRRHAQQPQETIKNSLGSGVIVSKEGHILTNHHVVANVDEIVVQLNDGREFPARIIGADDVADIAVIKIDAPTIKPLPLGDSDGVSVGQLVFAIGNPFGLQESVTKGIISATGRVTDENRVEYFQTEAVINPGNSGGPLVNIRGEIIGINTAIGNYSGSGTWQGVGFAIPSNTVRHALDGIIKTGRVVHGYLGISIEPITQELAEQYGLAEPAGALVQGITQGSPAEKGGLKPGDVLIAFNGKAIKGPRDLVRQINSATVGGKVELKLIRDRKELTLTVVIEEKPVDLNLGATQQPAPSQQPATPQPSGNPLSGVTVSLIPQELLANYPENVQGVLVTALAPQSPASLALQPGDVVEQINGQPVATLEEFQRLASTLGPGKNAVLSIARGKVRLFVVVRTGK
jgi:serine protease Do